MIGFERSLKIGKEFIFTHEDFKNEPLQREEFMGKAAGICYYNRDYSGELTELERKLKDHPRNYERRWDRIK